MYEHNSRLYKLISLFSFPVFWQPTLFLFLTLSKNLTSAQALLLTSIYSLAVVFLEVPGGAVADHFSRKLSAALGFVIKGLGFLALTFASNYYILIVFMIVAAYGESLTSGSIESLMYDTVKQDGARDKYTFKKLYSSTRSLLHLTLAAYVAIGGFIGKFNLALPLQLSFVFYVIAAYISMKFIEPDKLHSEKSYIDHIKEGFAFVFSKDGYNKGISSLFIADFFIIGLISAVFWLTAPLLNDIKLNVMLIGLISASTRLIKSLGSYLVSKYNNPNDLHSMLVSVIIMVVLFVITSIFYVPLMVIVMLLGFSLIQGLYQANDIQLLNDHIGTANRTTVNSIQNMFTRFYEFSVIPVIGLFIDKGQTSISIFLIATLLIIGLMILFFSRKKLSPEYYK